MALIAISCAERHVSRLLQVNLERQGYEVAIWPSVPDTHDQLQVSVPNTLLIDERGTAGQLRKTVIEARRLHPQIKVIVLRQRDSTDDSDNDDCHPDRVLTLPFDPFDLGGGGWPPATA